MEAVKTNILGTENVLEAAIDCAVNRVVVLSTDKAVYPINAMGISKAMMEKIAIAKSRLKSKIIIILLLILCLIFLSKARTALLAAYFASFFSLLLFFFKL